jgi:hypothetical protein
VLSGAALIAALPALAGAASGSSSADKASPDKDEVPAASR